jgi:hypothetical protein
VTGVTRPCAGRWSLQEPRRRPFASILQRHQSTHEANRTDQTLKIVTVLDGGDKFVYATIRPHSSLTTGDDCAASEMIAKTSLGMEIARRGPFEKCNLKTWVIREVAGA